MSIIVDKEYDEYIAAVGGRERSLLLWWKGRIVTTTAVYSHATCYSIWYGIYRVGNMLTFDDIHSSNGLSC
jgi:hypothetical protein